MPPSELIRPTPFTSALRETIAPAVRSAHERELREGWAMLNGQLRQKLRTDPSLLRKLRLFFLLVQLASFLRFRRSFPALATDQRSRVLDAFRDSRIHLFQKGFWGVSTLIKLSVYTHPGIQARIHYQPHRPSAVPEGLRADAP